MQLRKILLTFYLCLFTACVNSNPFGMSDEEIDELAPWQVSQLERQWKITQQAEREYESWRRLEEMKDTMNRCGGRCDMSYVLRGY